jgi:hypothetical protein
MTISTYLHLFPLYRLIHFPNKTQIFYDLILSECLLTIGSFKIEQRDNVMRVLTNKEFDQIHGGFTPLEIVLLSAVGCGFIGAMVGAAEGGRGPNYSIGSSIGNSMGTAFGFMAGGVAGFLGGTVLGFAVAAGKRFIR